MKRNWFVIAIILLITAGMWAQVAGSAKTEAKAAGCACCQMGDKAAMKDMKGHDHAAMSGMSCCAGMKKDAKDGTTCMRKDGKGCCAGMKNDAKATADAKGCGQDCCKDGKCAMAKDGKCCGQCAMAEGK